MLTRPIPYRLSYTLSPGTSGTITVVFNPLGDGPAGRCVFLAEGGVQLAELSTNGSNPAQTTIAPTFDGDTFQIVATYDGGEAPLALRLDYDDGAAAALSGQRLEIQIVPRWYDGHVFDAPQAVQFTSQDSSVRFDSPTVAPPSANAFAIAAWVATHTAGTILSLVDTATSPQSPIVALSIQASGAIALSYGDTTWATPQGSCANDGGWHHVAVHVDGGVAFFLLDGETVYVGNLPAPPQGAVGEILLGKGLSNDGGLPPDSDLFNLPFLGQYIGALLDVRLWVGNPPSVQQLIDSRFHFPPSTSYPEMTGYWQFVYNSGEVTGHQGQGLACNVAQVTVQVASTPQPYALRCNGTGGYALVEKSSLPPSVGDFTVETWARAPNGGGLISIGGAAPPGSGLVSAGFRFELESDGRLAILTSNGAGTTFGFTTPEPTGTSDGQWHHLAAARRSGIWTLYVDAIPVAEASGVDPVSALSLQGAPIAFGTAPEGWSPTRNARPETGQPPAAGGPVPDVVLTSMRLWSVARTQPELYAGMRAQIPRTSPDYMSLLGCWPMLSASLVDVSEGGPLVPIRNATTVEHDGVPLTPPRRYAGVGVGGGAAYFEASPDARYPFGVGPFTVEGWVELLGNSASPVTPVLLATPLTPEPGAAFYVSFAITGVHYSGIQAYFYDPSGRLPSSGQVFTASLPSPSGWHHYAVVWDGTAFEIFIDGLPAPISASTLGSAVSVPKVLSIGGWSAAAPSPIGITELRFWSVARSAPEIQATMYRTLAGTEPSLAGYWNFEFDDGYDKSLLHNPASPTAGAAITTYPFPEPLDLPLSSLHFGPPLGYATVANDAALFFPGTAPYTLAAWIKLAQGADGDYVIMSRWNEGVWGNVMLQVVGQKLTAKRNVSPYTLTGTTTLEAERWYHVACTYDGQSLTTYVNGAMDGSQDFGAVATSISSSFLLGAYFEQGAPAHSLLGEIAEAAVWSVALDATQIWELAFQQGSTRMPQPIAHWDFKTGSPDDVSGHGHTATPVDLAGFAPSDFSPSQSGYALCFAEPGAYVDCGAGPSLALTGALTLEAWIRVDRFGAAGEVVVGHSSGFRFARNGSTGEMSFIVAGLSASVSTPQGVDDGLWHHYAGVWNPASGTLSLYVDDALAAMTGGVGGTPSYGSGDAFTIGSSTFPGYVKEVRVWSGALDFATQIEPQMIRQMVGHEEGLVGYWKSSARTATVEADLSGGGRTGSYQGAVTTAKTNVDLLPPQPFVIASSQMMQDWSAGDATSNVKEGTTIYRTVVAVYDANGNPAAGQRVRCWANSPVSIEVGGVSHAIDDVSGAELVADYAGQIVISSVSQALSTPSLKLWGAWMRSDDRVVISPDDNVLQLASTVTGSALLQPRNTQPPLLPSGFTAGDADAVAQAINNAVLTVQEGQVGTSGDRAALRRRYGRDGARRAAGVPEPKGGVVADVQSSNVSEADGQWWRPLGDGPIANWAISMGASAVFHDDAPADAGGRLARFRTLSREDAAGLVARLRDAGARGARSWSDVKDAWNSFWKAGKQVADFVITEASNLGGELATGVGIIVTWADEALDQALQIVIQDVERVGEAICGLLSQVVGAFLDALSDLTAQVLAWFREEFGWADVLSTKAALAHVIDQMAPATIDICQALTRQIDSIFSSLEDHLAADVDWLVARIGGKTIDDLASGDFMTDGTTSRLRVRRRDRRGAARRVFQRTSLAAGAGETPQEIAHDVIDAFRTGASWLLDKVTSNVDAESGIRGAELALPGTFVDTLEAYAATIATRLSNDRAVQAFQQALGYFAQIATHPESLVQLLLEGFLRIGEAIALAGMEIINAAIDVVVGLIADLVSALRSAWNAPIYIPVVSWLYENVITWDPSTGRGSTLTPLDFFSLLLAIPVTYAFKAATGAPPLTQAQLQEVLSWTPSIPSGLGDLGERFRGAMAAHREPRSQPRWSPPKLTGIEPLWSVSYAITYVFWAPIDVLLDVQTVLESFAKVGGLEQKCPDIDNLVRGFDMSGAGRGITRLRRFFSMLSYLFPFAFQVLGWPPAGPTSTWEDWADLSAAQIIDITFWFYKTFFATLIPVVDVARMAWSGAVKTVTDLFNNIVFEELEENLEDVLPSLSRILSNMGSMGSLARRTKPWLVTLGGGIWEAFAIALLVAEAIEIESWSEAPVVAEWALKSAQNLTEGLSPLAKFCGDPWVAEGTEGWSLAALLIGDLVSDGGAAVLQATRFAVSLGLAGPV